MRLPLFLSIDDLAFHMRVNRAEAQSMVERGELPPPVEIGRIQRWRTEDLQAIGSLRQITADDVFK